VSVVHLTGVMNRYFLLVTVLENVGPSTSQAQVTQLSLEHLLLPAGRGLLLMSPSSVGAGGAEGAEFAEGRWGYRVELGCGSVEGCGIDGLYTEAGLTGDGALC